MMDRLGNWFSERFSKETTEFVYGTSIELTAKESSVSAETYKKAIRKLPTYFKRMNSFNGEPIRVVIKTGASVPDISRELKAGTKGASLDSVFILPEDLGSQEVLASLSNFGWDTQKMPEDVVAQVLILRQFFQMLPRYLLLKALLAKEGRDQEAQSLLGENSKPFEKSAAEFDVLLDTGKSGCLWAVVQLFRGNAGGALKSGAERKAERAEELIESLVIAHIEGPEAFRKLSAGSFFEQLVSWASKVKDNDVQKQQMLQKFDAGQILPEDLSAGWHPNYQWPAKYRDYNFEHNAYINEVTGSDISDELKAENAAIIRIYKHLATSQSARTPEPQLGGLQAGLGALAGNWASQNIGQVRDEVEDSGIPVRKTRVKPRQNQPDEVDPDWVPASFGAPLQPQRLSGSRSRTESPAKPQSQLPTQQPQRSKEQLRQQKPSNTQYRPPSRPTEPGSGQGYPKRSSDTLRELARQLRQNDGWGNPQNQQPQAPQEPQRPTSEPYYQPPRKSPFQGAQENRNKYYPKKDN